MQRRQTFWLSQCHWKREKQFYLKIKIEKPIIRGHCTLVIFVGVDFLAVLEKPELVRLGNETPKHNQLRFRFPPKKIITRQVGKKILKRKIFTLTLVVAAQLVERSLATPRVRGSNRN